MKYSSFFARAISRGYVSKELSFEGDEAGMGLGGVCLLPIPEL
jgi:hypothetical protein